MRMIPKGTKLSRIAHTGTYPLVTDRLWIAGYLAGNEVGFGTVEALVMRCSNYGLHRR